MNPSRGTTLSRAMMAAVCALVLTGQAWAGGFSIYEQGAAATAQGGAFVARAWDASAAFYNPAGLAAYGIPGQWRLYGGVTPVQSLSKMTGLDPYPGAGVQEEAKEKWFPPFFFYAAYQINENMAGALGITTPFGLGTEWKNPNNTYSGRFRSIMADIQTVTISPTFSYKFNDMFSAGLGIDYVYSKVKLQRHRGKEFANGDETRDYDVMDINLEGKDEGSIGFHAAILAKLNEQWSVGIDYKHSVKNDYKGDATFHQISSGISALDQTIASLMANPTFGGVKQSGNTSVEYPASLVTGVAYKPIDKLNMELDFAYVMWSSFKQVVIEFPESQYLTPSILDENYDDTWQIRFGAEYWMMPKLALRCGYIYDKTPAPTETVNPLLPDADRHDVSIGLGYKVSDNLRVDAAYMAVMFKERSTEGKNLEGYDGIYKSHVNLFAFGLDYTFGGK